MQFCFTIVFSQIERGLCLSAVKTKINTPLVYEMPEKGTMKSEILHHLSVAKRGYDLKNDRVEVIQCGLLTSRKQLAKG